jgi:hypothetical protein
LNIKENFFYIGQVWGNLISYLVLKPKEKKDNETLSNEIGKYSKCGADFSEKEYKGAEVVNQIDRKTVCINRFDLLGLLDYFNTRLIFFVLFIFAYVFAQY